METAGKLCTVNRICGVTGREGSGYYKNPNYVPAKQDDFEYQHSLTKALPSAIKTFNKRARAVGQDSVGLIFEQTVKKLKHLQWCLENANYNSQQDAGTELKILLKELQ